MNFVRKALHKCVVIFSALPPACTTIEGPHSDECLRSLWINSGCLIVGYGAPHNLTSVEYRTVRTQTIE